MKNTHRMAACLFAGTAAVAFAGAACAQTASSTAGTLEEIVVTAQRRSENLQDVPITVSTFSAAKIADIGVLSTDSLTAVVPGLMVTRRAIGAVPYVRGVGSQNVIAAAKVQSRSTLTASTT